MDHATRTFVFVGTVVNILLAMYLLPTITIGNIELGHINVVSDILPKAYQQKDGIDVIPMPKPPVQEDYCPEGVTMISDYSNGQPGGMGHFYRMLYLRGSLDRPVRIAYFGDSFIEGDVFTAPLREQLQQHFGGNGVGWVDPGDKLKGFRLTVRQKSKDFKAYEVVSKPFDHRNEGINQRYFIPREGASIWTCGTDFCPRTRQWEQSVLYLRTAHGVQVSACLNDQQEQCYTQHIDSSAHVQRLLIAADTVSSVSYRFNGVTSGTYIYGMALESRKGVILDNFSMRGSSGITLAKMPDEVLADFSRLRPYDLIILHFGLNVVSDRSHAANYQAYTRQIGGVVSHLRQAFPKTSILIVGVSDRDQRTPAGIRTIKGIESLSAYQQILADSQHVAYFNLFQAMGGRESMARLVEQGLANKDYVHLTHAGGKAVSKHLYESLVAGYENYRRRIYQ